MKKLPSPQHPSDQSPCDRPSTDPIDALVASFAQSLFMRARAQSDATKMTSNASIPFSYPKTYLTSTIQQEQLPALSDSDRMGQVQSSPPTQQTSLPHPEFGNSSFIRPRPHGFVPSVRLPIPTAQIALLTR